MTIAHNPPGNGGAERSNASMEQRLRAMSADSPTDWPEHLAAAEYSHNDSKNKAIGYSPFELLYGETPKSHLDDTRIAACKSQRTKVREHLERETLSRAGTDYCRAS